jgi:elongation factor P--(R)-beta-lysine ligase
MSVGADWRPTATRERLALRAGMLAATRAHFAARGVLEVETPALSTAAVTDLHLASLEVRTRTAPRYLHTSPEYAMKRLLAAGSGDIWQLARVFRGEEVSARHNPEFTLLEWYRVGLTLDGLVDDIDTLLRALLDAPLAGRGMALGPARRLSHRDALREHAGVDPHLADVGMLAAAARRHLGDIPQGLDRDALLDLLQGAVVAPRLGHGEVTYLVDWPASQAALARLRTDDAGVAVAARVEAYVDGLELCNGFEELTDPAEQRARFATDAERRQAAGLAVPPVDERFLAALAHGLPPCSGVAVGFDRVVMLAAGTRDIRDVLAFPYDLA